MHEMICSLVPTSQLKAIMILKDASSRAFFIFTKRRQPKTGALFPPEVFIKNEKKKKAWHNVVFDARELTYCVKYVMLLFWFDEAAQRNIIWDALKFLSLLTGIELSWACAGKISNKENFRHNLRTHSQR